MRTKAIITVLIVLLLPVVLKAQIISTYAGNGTTGYSGDGGPATSAQLAWPFGIAVDNGGNLYIADHDNNVIRKVNNAGIITTIAGTGALGYTGDGGPAISAKMYHPGTIALDNSGNIYFTDQNADVIRKINTAGIITTITGNLPSGNSGDGGPLIAAQFQSISGLSFDAANNMYITDYGSGVIRKVNTAGIISTIAGNGTLGFSGDGGPATAAQLNHPYNVVVDGAGNIYIPDHLNNRIRKVNTAGIISTYAGTGVPGYSGDGGPAVNANMRFPWYIAIDNADTIYVSEPGNEIVRKITPAGIITTVAGNGTSGYSGDGGPAIAAQMIDVCGIAVDNARNIFIVNRTFPNVVRKINNCLTAIVNQQPLNAFLCTSGDTSFSVIAVNAGTYQWQLNSGSGWNNVTDNAVYSGSTSNTLLVTGAHAGMSNYQYRCVISNGCGPLYSAAATLTVTAPLTPAVSITANTTTVCQGTPVTFTATPINGGIVPSFQWLKNGVPTGTNNNTYADNSLNNGDVISCILTSNASCVSANSANSNSVIITVQPLVSPSVTITASSNNICFGTPVTFNATTLNAGTAPLYQWKKNGLNVGAPSLTYTDNALNNGDVISFGLVSNQSCITNTSAASNSIIMNVTPLINPAITISANDLSVCPGTSISFAAIPVNGGGLPVYQWKKNGIDVGINSGSYTDNGFINGDKISCILTSNATCLSGSTVASNILTVTIFPNPVVLLDQTNTICVAGTRQLDAGSFSSYLWNDGSTNRALTIHTTGTFYVTVTDNNGCSGSDTTIVNTSLPKPADFLPPDTAVCDYGSVELKPSTNYRNYLWSNGAINRDIIVTDPGLYWLEVTDLNNCKGKDTVLVNRKECLKGFFIPSGFTPNNDALNDIFRPLIFGHVIQYKFQVYNRWGQLVFESNELKKGWDGAVRGVKQNTGVYVWLCKFQLENQEPRLEKGTVTLIR